MKKSKIIKITKSELDKIKNLNVLVIGDSIIDEYYFTSPKGRTIKYPILSVDYIRHERYAGGVLAIANHVSNFVKNVKLVTLLGDKKRNEKFAVDKLNKNINGKFFTKKNAFTTIKRRFIDNLREEKMFKIEFITDTPISKELEMEIIAYLRDELPKYNLIVVGDFGHGFISDNIVKVLEKNSKYLCVNVQTNSANMGFNYFVRYKKPDYIVLNETELRLGMHSRFEPVRDIIKKFNKKNNYKRCLTTMGKGGALYLRNGKIYESAALIHTPKDTVGAGDAVFAITSLFDYINTNPELMPFYANCIGAIAVSFMGNEKSITKEDIFKLLRELK